MNHEQEVKPVTAFVTVQLFEDGTCSLQYAGETKLLLAGLKAALSGQDRGEEDAA